MNKKVDEDFKYINDVYVLQCICTEYKDLVNKFIENELKLIVLIMQLQKGVDIND